jgi:acyl-CoA oxidase
MKVFDHPTMQIRILTLLATPFTLHYTGEYMYMPYQRSWETIKKGHSGPLAGLHSVNSRLKSLCATPAADGIKTCQRETGSHEVGGGSGLVDLNAEYLSNPTVEGGSWMITQQVIAHLTKKTSDTVKHPDVPIDPIGGLFHFFFFFENHTRRIP